MAALDQQGVAYQSHIESKEGHGILKESNRLEYFQLVSEFLTTHIGD